MRPDRQYLPERDTQRHRRLPAQPDISARQPTASCHHCGPAPATRLGKLDWQLYGHDLGRHYIGHHIGHDLGPGLITAAPTGNSKGVVPGLCEATAPGCPGVLSVRFLGASEPRRRAAQRLY